MVYSGENYADSKVEAEKAVHAHAGKMPFTILRPGFIYGPGEQGLVAKTVKLLERIPVLPVIGSGRELIRPRPLIHANAG